MSTETATSPRTVWEEPNAVQIRVSLDGVEPAIYRRLVVPDDFQQAFDSSFVRLRDFHPLVRSAGARIGRCVSD